MDKLLALELTTAIEYARLALAKELDLHEISRHLNLKFPGLYFVQDARILRQSPFVHDDDSKVIIL